LIFVFFMLDQLSAKWIEEPARSCIPTPNLDRLQAMGVTFLNAFTSNPVCCPARATLATGLTSRQHGVLQNGYQLDPALPTFMQILQNAGWQTAACGKVHLKPHFAGVYPDYHPYGFDSTHITEDARAGEWLDWVENNHPDHYEGALATIWAGGLPDLAAYGPQRTNLRERLAEIRKDFDWSSPELPNGTPGNYALPYPADVSQTEWITGHGLDFLRAASREQPFLATSAMSSRTVPSRHRQTRSSRENSQPPARPKLEPTNSHAQIPPQHQFGAKPIQPGSTSRNAADPRQPCFEYFSIPP